MRDVDFHDRERRDRDQCRLRTDGGSDSPESESTAADADSTAEASDSASATETSDAESATESRNQELGNTYIESTIIMTTVRLVAPFVMTFGLFVTLHGADSPGGGFQGGVVLASVLIMIAFAYGTAPTRDWINAGAIAGLIGGGVVLFAAIGIGALVFGGNFLEYLAYGGATTSKYAIELVELGIGATVVGIVTSIFFLLSRGFDVTVEEEGESP